MPPERNSDAAAGGLLDIFEMQEILSKLFLRDQIWGFVKVLRELSNGLALAFLGTFRKAPELKSLDHLLAKFSHRIPSLVSVNTSPLCNRPHTIGCFRRR